MKVRGGKNTVRWCGRFALYQDGLKFHDTNVWKRNYYQSSKQQSRCILVRFPLVLHSDYKNLSFDNFRSERGRRRRLLLEEYIYEFVYTPGKEYIIADMISRYPMQPIIKNDFVELNTLYEDDYIPRLTTNSLYHVKPPTRNFRAEQALPRCPHYYYHLRHQLSHKQGQSCYSRQLDHAFHPLLS